MTDDRLQMEITNHKMRAMTLDMIGSKDSAAEWYLYDCLSTLKTILDSGDCNDCSKSRSCPYCPKPGQLVRYNCPYFKKKH